MVDTVVRVVTPEGISFDLHPAGPLPRLAAFLLDTLIGAIALIAVLVVAQALGMNSIWIELLAAFTTTWFYMVAFEMLNGGKTPGKGALGLQVVQRDGTPPRFGSSILRNLLRVADYFLGLGVVVPLFVHGFRRLGDLAAGTLVIYVPGQLRPWSARHFQGVQPKAPERILDTDASLAVIEFARRRSTLGPALRRELSELALPLYVLDPGETKDAETTLVSIGAWCSGIRRD